MIEAHSHNGVDSDKIIYTDLLELPEPENLRHVLHFNFETSARYVSGTNGTGGSAVAFNTQGLQLTNGTGGVTYPTAFVQVLGSLANLKIFDVPIILSVCMKPGTESADGVCYTHVSVGGQGGLTLGSWSNKHFGFQVESYNNVVQGAVGNGTAHNLVNLDI